MALRAAGLDSPRQVRASLDSIAAEFGVSRETVRRARIDLLRAMQPPSGTSREATYASLSLSVPVEPSSGSPATARALRRLLTVTGPLSWDEVLSAWARARGKPPYSALPADAATMREWAKTAGGFTISSADLTGKPPVIGVVSPEELDQVSQFLLEALGAEYGGLDRNALLDRAEAMGLKRTTIATALSAHPAVTRLGRSTWALRGQRRRRPSGPSRIAEPRRTLRARPTAFTWDTDGSLLIEFSAPRGPSPVVAVPRAVSNIVEGREFAVGTDDTPMRVTVRNAKLWGFGPLLSKLSLPAGTRVTIALDLLAGTATIAPTQQKGIAR